MTEVMFQSFDNIHQRGIKCLILAIPPISFESVHQSVEDLTDCHIAFRETRTGSHLTWVGLE